MFWISLYLAFCWISTFVALALWLFTWQRRHRLAYAAPWYLGMITASLLWSLSAIFSLTAPSPYLAYLSERIGEVGSGLVSLFFVLTLMSLWPKYHLWAVRLAVGGLLFHAFIHVYLSFLPVTAERLTLGDYSWWRIIRDDPTWERVLWVLLVYVPAVVGLWLYRRAYHRWWSARPRWVRIALSGIVTLILVGALLNILDVGVFGLLEIFPPSLWLLLLLVGVGILSLHYEMTPALSSEAVLRRIREGVMVFDAFDRLVWWNEEAERALHLEPQSHQYYPAEVVLRAWPDLLHVYHASTGQPVHLTLVMQGQPRHWEVVALNLVGSQDAPLGRVLVFYDLSEYRRMERTLAFRAETEALYRNLIHLGQGEVLDDDDLLRRAGALIYHRLHAFGLQGLAVYRASGERLAAWGEHNLCPPRLSDDVARAQDMPILMLEENGQRFGWLWYREASGPEGFPQRPVLQQAGHLLVQRLARQREERRLRLLHEVYMQMSDAVMVFNAQGQLVDMNHAASLLLGVPLIPSPTEIGLRLDQILTLSPQQRLEMERSLIQDGQWQAILPLRTPEGEERTVEVKLSRLRGGPLGVSTVAVLRDITEQEALRTALAHQRTLLEHLLRIARAVLEAPLSVQDMFHEAVRIGREVTSARDFGLILFKPDGTVRDVILALKDAEVSHDVARAWAHTLLQGGLLARVVQRPRPRYLRDLARCPWREPGHSMPWRSLVLIPLMTGSHVLGLFIAGHAAPRALKPADLAVLRGTAEILALGLTHAQLYEEQIRLAHERLLAKEQAERLREREERFISNVSHEMRTPLQAILGYLEWILRDTDPETPYRDLADDLQKVAQAAQTLKDFIDQLLDYQRARQTQSLHIVPVRVHDVVNEVVDLVQPLIARGQNTLVIDIIPVDLQLRTDPDKLRHILLNLLSNAAKFTRNGHITVRARAQMRRGTPGVTITVADTGIGIPAEAQQWIFEPFAQADGEIARRFGGTGLGLALVREYTQALGGEISLTSQVGKGSEFTVWLPDGGPETRAKTSRSGPLPDRER
ncbi:MAG: GAF domain-containing protein [Chloroflexi bacterium]|nr:GAF domain-containing protein [Chloroflexota bacterium]